jgi:hypothetical protein
MASLTLTGDTSGQVTIAAPAVAGTNTLTLQAATATNAVNTYGSTLNTTSGTTALFSSIPSWAKKITVGLSSVTYASTSLITIQLGTSGGLVSSGYTGQVYTQNTSASSFSTAFLLQAANSSGSANSGIATLFLVDSTNNIWAFASTIGSVGSTAASMGGGRVALASALTQLQISTVAGTTFSAGAVNILYEG